MIGAKFDQNVHLNYTRLNLYSSEPKLLGTYEDVLKTPTQMNDMREFYKHFQKRIDHVEQFFEILVQIILKQKFYFYYNSMYWYLDLKEPFINISYDEEPLPK
jgi:hypothetical protein